MEANQFKQISAKGKLTLLPDINVISVQIDKDQVGEVVAGDAVKIKDVPSDGQVIVEKATAGTDDIFGLVCLSVRKDTYKASEFVKVALDDCAMVMEASGAIAGGAKVAIDPATGKVAEAGVGGSIGRALHKVAADGDLVTVLIKIEAASV